MVVKLGTLGRQALQAGLHVLRKQPSGLTKPATTAVVHGCLNDCVRSTPQLLAEKAVLRQHLIVLHRSVKRPRVTPTDRSLLVLLARRVRAWK